MKYLLSEEQMAADFAATGDLPPTNDLTENPVFTEILDALPKGREYASYAENSYIYDMNSTVGSEIMGALTESYIEMIYGEMSAAEALEWAEEQANELLAGS
jgi:ABC-type glycerol-3-phosphate transport system substrate-binding protein